MRYALLACLALTSPAWAGNWWEEITTQPGSFAPLRPLKARYTFGWSAFTAGNAEADFARTKEGEYLLKILDPIMAAEPEGRAIIRISVGRIADSCGYGVPLYAFGGHRSQLPAWAARKGPQGLHEYQEQKNRLSIDGLPALGWPETTEPG